MQKTAFDHRPIAVLGLLTICAYGSWYYAFGVLIDPIMSSTGWSESLLAGSFSAGVVLVGVLSLFAGALLDRMGHRVVFALGGALGTSGLVVASWSPNGAVFFASSAIALGGIGSLGFYHITMATSVRLNPHHGHRAIAILTVWGALASAVFLR